MKENDMNKSVRCALAALAIVGFIGVATAQKKSESSLEWRDWGGNDRLKSHCEIKEQTLPAGGIITVDGKQNGGISIKGWERNEVLVRSRIQTQAPTQAEADQLAREVRVETAGLSIHAESPQNSQGYQWYRRFQEFVP